jgi:hypothetical protein
MPRIFLRIAYNFRIARLKDSASDSPRPGDHCPKRHRLVPDGITEHEPFSVGISQEKRAIFRIQHVEYVSAQGGWSEKKPVANRIAGASAPELAAGNGLTFEQALRTITLPPLLWQHLQLPVGELEPGSPAVQAQLCCREYDQVIGACRL